MTPVGCTRWSVNAYNFFGPAESVPKWAVHVKSTCFLFLNWFQVSKNKLSHALINSPCVFLPNIIFFSSKKKCTFCSSSCIFLFRLIQNSYENHFGGYTSALVDLIWAQLCFSSSPAKTIQLRFCCLMHQQKYLLICVLRCSPRRLIFSVTAVQASMML